MYINDIKKKFLVPDGFTGEFYQTFNKHQSYTNSQPLSENRWGNTSQLILGARIILKTKPNWKGTKKRKLQTNIPHADRHKTS